MAVEVFVADEQTDHVLDHLRWLHLAEKVLAAEGVRGDAELSVLFVDEQAMTDLNQRFHSSDGPTDVLAFPIDEEPSEGGRSPDSGGTGPGYMPAEPADLPMLLGDVVICPAVAAKNAPEHAGTFEDEIALLLVHGILHLMGMDHLDDEEADVMEAREQELLAHFHRPPSPLGTAPAPADPAAAGTGPVTDPAAAPADPGAGAASPATDPGASAPDPPAGAPPAPPSGP